MANFGNSVFSVPANRARARDLVVRSARLFPFRHWGENYYERGALYCANKFFSIPEVDSVWLKEGAEEKFVPAVSDLDFVLKLNDEWNRSTLEILRERYRELRRDVPILGECIVATPRSRALFHRVTPAFGLLYSRLRYFAGGEWERRGYPLSGVRKESRAALGAEYYGKAMGVLRETVAESGGYHEALFKKECRKVDRFAARSPSPGDQRETLVSAFESLLALGEGLTAEPVTGVNRTVVPEIPPVSDPIAEIVNEAWRAAFRRFSSEASALQLTAHRGFFLLDDTSPGTIRNLFAAYLSFLRQNDRPYPAMAITILPKSIYLNFFYGWSWGSPWPLLETLIPQELEAFGGGGRLGADLGTCLRERLASLLLIVPGRLIAPSPSADGVITQFAHEAISLATGVFTLDKKFAAALGRDVLPVAAQCLVDPRLAADSDGAVALLCEVQAYLESNA
jgi:hypothetical protein